jgi:transcriptional regulator with XRE-family HTH domain
MELKKAFGEALRKIRTAKNLTQEDFSSISSRTYLSTLERGVYSPTVDKLDAISSILGVHPVTVLTACYLRTDANTDAQSLLARVELELTEINKSSKPS